MKVLGGFIFFLLPAGGMFFNVVVHGCGNQRSRGTLDLLKVFLIGELFSRVIDRSKEALNGKLFRGDTGALAAADASDLAHFALFGSFFRRVAVNVNFGFCRNKGNHSPGADFGAFAATHAQFTVDKSKVVGDFNGSERTGVDTAPKPQTAVTASLGASGNECGSGAIGNTVVVEVAQGLQGVSAAADNSSLACA